MRADPETRRREDALARAFDLAPDRWAAVRHRAREVFDGLDLRGKRVLDVGAGIGVYSLYMTRVLGAREAIALEPSAGIGGHTDITQRMRDRLAGIDDARVTLVEQTFQDYQPDGPFDAVVLLNSINHLHETRAALSDDPPAMAAFGDVFARLHATLAPGGALLINELDRRCLERYTSRLGVPRFFTRGIDYDLHQAPETWADLARAAGFEGIRVRGVSPRRLASWPTAIARHRAVRFATNAMFVMTARRT